MRGKEIRERSEQELVDLEARLARDVFRLRFQNFTNRLDDSSQLAKIRKDLARVKTVRRQRVLAAAADAGKKDKP
ncbi:MAG: 50S ribosomal protein L29 [Deltaproteobacteria bacterium]|nr:50S ribosomal protein L29 [Deltaproteobacteria bacterium]